MNMFLWIVGGIVFLLFLPMLVVWFLRALGPHSKKMTHEQAQLDRKTRATSGTSATTTATNGGSRLERLTSHWLSILVVIVGIVLMYWASETQVRPEDMGSWGWNHLLSLLIFWGIGAALIALNVSALGKAAGVLQWVLTGGMLILLIGFPVGSWVASNTASGCVSGHPCVLSLNDDGSSDAVEVKEGEVACFDPWMWKRLGEVGLMISYQKGPDEPFPCSREQVFTGSCTAVYDQFWFKPSKKTVLPNYWFVASGSKRC